MFFIKIEKSSLLSPESKKDIMLLWYIYSIESRNEYIYLDINNLVRYYGYTPSTKEKGVNTMFKNSLKKMIEDNYLRIHSSSTNNFTMSFIKNNNHIPICMDITTDFVMLDSSEMHIILSYYQNNKKDKKSYIDNTLHLYLIIKSFMNFNNQNIPFCFPSILKLQLYSGLSKQSILNTIDTLKNIGLIYTSNLGNYITDKGTIKTIPLVYSLQPIKKNVLKNYISSMKNNFNDWM
jgi:hypothetical protein